MGFKTHKLEKPLQAYNVDGTKNKQGMIKYYVNLNLEINERKMPTELLVTGLGKERIILGFPWLQEQNPDINWNTGKFSWREPRKQRFLNLPTHERKGNAKLFSQNPQLRRSLMMMNGKIKQLTPSVMTWTYLFPTSMATWTGMFGLTLNQQRQWKYRQR